ncbi:hypothetical protein A2U01_0009973, partial [Trifolium medium]|nr:hypothetical protein [Trifolium medium]
MAEVNLDNLNLSDDEALDFELEEDSAEQNDINLCLSMAVTKATHGLYLFKFFHPLDVEAVIKGGLWTFDNFTLIIDRLKVGVGRGLVNYIGEFLEYDKNNNTSIWRKYMRVRVRVDVRKPLKIEKKINLNGGGGGLLNMLWQATMVDAVGRMKSERRHVEMGVVMSLDGCERK